MSIGILLKDNVILNRTDSISSTTDVRIADLQEIEDAISSLKGFRDALQYKNDHEIKKLIQDFEMNKNTLMESRQELKTEMSDETEDESDDKDSCNGRWFELTLMLDDSPTEVSWELKNEQTNVVVAHESYSEDDRFTQQMFFLCVDPAPYVFSIFDASKNGINCRFGYEKGCYNIYLDDDLIINGPEFDGEVAVHYFDSSSSFCTVGSIFKLQLRLDPKYAENQWHLQNNETKEFIKILPLSEDNSREGESISYIACLFPGKYNFILFDDTGNKISCRSENSQCLLNPM